MYAFISIKFLLLKFVQIKANEKRSSHVDVIEGWNDPRFKLIHEMRNSISSEEFEIMKVFGEQLDRFSTHLLVTGLYW